MPGALGLISDKTTQRRALTTGCMGRGFNVLLHLCPQALNWEGAQADVRTFASYGDGMVADVTAMTQVGGPLDGPSAISVPESISSPLLSTFLEHRCAFLPHPAWRGLRIVVAGVSESPLPSLQVAVQDLSSPNGFYLGTDPVYNTPVLIVNASVSSGPEPAPPHTRSTADTPAPGSTWSIRSTRSTRSRTHQPR